MKTSAIVLTEPRRLSLASVALRAPQPRDAVVEVEFSGISQGTERMLWDGSMPPFPGMGYPLVPGYEAVGRVVEAGAESGREVGERVFVPGARCYEEVNGLFGGSASVLVVEGARCVRLPEGLGEAGVLLALAATARRVVAGSAAPELIVGHGVLGRLIARIAVAERHAPPVVWEREVLRRGGARGYEVIEEASDARRDYAVIVDASGRDDAIDAGVSRLGKGGEIVLAGFYAARIGFAFPAAFMAEARIRVSAEFAPADMAAVIGMVEGGRLSLDGLISHRRAAADAPEAYATAFGDPACLKMILDWKDAA